ncbi:flagellar basal body L-ring protein FlgH [Dasania marina]|uniref:flagellar basal body L-ring protein FlgH n=1 Tax=Dasania marina TaxID=471499 RepID=UPI0030D89087|tara:strand:- start:56953 stop:57648 length:696 start_codon:yes stop_codon:yes gene_type:complete
MLSYGVGIKVVVYSLLALSLTACIAADPQPNDPAYAPVLGNNQHAHVVTSSGSLYQAGYRGSLFSDKRAARVGDVLTILLDERTSSSKKSETEIKKESDMAFNAGTLFGRNITYNGDEILSAGVTQDRDFKGDAASDQSNRLQGSITVTVSDVLPNGLLAVRGEKWMTLTNGEEFIRVKGLVRQEDISPNNTVSSTKLADARITYSGTGDFADASKQGWGNRFFNSKWWPF